MNNIILKAENITKEFGSLRAVDEATFSIESGTATALIGPNGAGKTTLFNCLSGIYDIDDGTIALHGEDITNIPSHDMAKRGLARSYQISNLFENFTVFENLRLAAQIQTENNMNIFKNHRAYDGPRQVAERVANQVGLAEQQNVDVNELPHGQKRQLEVGMTLATDPDIILFDEPTAGMARESVGDVVDLIDEIKENNTILLIEHNIDMVMSFADRVLVLHQGQIIADGPPKEVRENEQVRKAYIGTEGDLEEL
jgi:branched-chain amino acid transport system ATP-binding protein